VIKILVIEDDHDTRITTVATIKHIINEHGVDATVDSVVNGIRGAKACKVIAYDIIVLDMMLPMVSGLDTARTIRRMGQSKKAVIIGNSVRESDRKYVAKSLLAGVDYFAKKPLSFESVERFLGIGKSDE
jgi:DNA-binding response OmpR family regulator